MLAFILLTYCLAAQVTFRVYAAPTKPAHVGHSQKEVVTSRSKCLKTVLEITMKNELEVLFSDRLPAERVKNIEMRVMRS